MSFGDFFGQGIVKLRCGCNKFLPRRRTVSLNLVLFLEAQQNNLVQFCLTIWKIHMIRPYRFQISRFYPKCSAKNLIFGSKGLQFIRYIGMVIIYSRIKYYFNIKLRPIDNTASSWTYLKLLAHDVHTYARMYKLIHSVMVIMGMPLDLTLASH